MEIDEEYDIVDDYIGERNEEVLISGNISTPNKRVIEKKKYQEYAMDSIRLFDSKSWEPINTESYYPLIENDYLSPLKEPLSTFGIDVDNASYAVMRTKINSRQVVPKDAVRIEEFVNYFNYSYSQPTGSAPFSINLENANCPWNSKHQLVRIGLKGKEIDYHNLQSSNLVFLIDVSGSMSDENKLPLVKKSLKLLVDQMGNNDRIAIVTYAGAAGLALKSTRCNEKDFIKKKIDKLDAGGSTAGGQGIQLAYKVALENLINEGNNRVILCTDGDFNVGQSSDAAMKNLIIQNRNKGIFITACGFGMGNYQDSKMETIADNGNGNYFYIDTYRESTKVFERDIRATLFTIAKDVKIQVEFNPKHVKAYRLIGYENRKMPPQDFADDTKDGGELGAGHTVTALYEIIPASSSESIPGEYNLKYQRPKVTSATNFSDELLTVKLRYKQPNGSTSSLVQKSIKSGAHAFNDASQDFRFAAGTALFAQQLRQSKYIDQPDFSLAKRILVQAKGSDVNGDRQELITLINQAENVYSTYSKRD
ncbi:MAG: VWA domain-containing protein [Bacteroidia bacterium]|nr:VWA domain-containing protein [Bacteroidia bacterium]